jgi:hydroxymethylglutaryl-CoA lyase
VHSSNLVDTHNRYVSCIFADPYDGPTQPSSVLHAVKELFKMGCYEVSLGDTLGIGSPGSVRVLLEYLEGNGVPMSRLAGHFHDTYKQARANVWEAYCCGVKTFDSSVAGIGGCPFVPEAKGNASTEDLVNLFENAGISTGVNMEELIRTSVWISNVLGESITRTRKTISGAPLSIPGS